MMRMMIDACIPDEINPLRNSDLIKLSLKKWWLFLEGHDVVENAEKVCSHVEF